MHIDVSDFFQAIKWLHLAQFSHLTFEERNSELCGMLRIPWNGIFFFIKIIFSSDTSTERAAAIFKNLSSRYNYLRRGDYSGLEYNAILGH